MIPDHARDELISRLRKIEGQAQGIQRMLADGRDCLDVINQLASVREATRRASLELMKHHIHSCIESTDYMQSEHAVDDMIKLLLRI